MDKEQAKGDNYGKRRRKKRKRKMTQHMEKKSMKSQETIDCQCSNKGIKSFYESVDD